MYLKIFSLFKVHDALENENDDIDGSGSGYGGDDEDDDIPTSSKDKPHIKLDSPTNTLHHSGDGSDHHIDDTDDDTDDKFHEDHVKPIHSVEEDEDNLYFENNSTDTEKTINPTTTDDEESQLIFLYYLLLFAYVMLFLQNSFSFGNGVFLDSFGFKNSFCNFFIRFISFLFILYFF